MIKILHVIGDLNAGGAQTMLYKLLANTDRTVFLPIVISMQNKGIFGNKIEALDVAVHCLNMHCGHFQKIKALFQFRRIIRCEKPSIIQTWMYHANVFGYFASRFCGRTAFVMNIRDSLSFYSSHKWTTRLVIRLNAWLSTRVSAVINNSQVSQRQHGQIGFAKHNMYFIPNGFDLSVFQVQPEKRVSFKKEHTISESTKILGMFARFHPQKNHRAFLEIAKILMKKSDDWCFVLAGTDCDKNNAILMSIIHDCGLQEKVILLGSVNTANYLPVLDVYLSTSISEGFPNIIGEAMACGVPCVATEVGDCRQIIGEYGYIAPVDDINMLAQYCEAALLKTESEKMQMRSYVEKNYSIKNIARQYENLYLQLTGH